jgi:hypothetical protein
MRGHRARAGKLDRRDLSRAQRLALTYSEVTKATARPGRDRYAWGTAGRYRAGQTVPSSRTHFRAVK